MDADAKAAIESQAMDMFGRHFVSLGGSYVWLDEQGKSHGKLRGFNYSGFILSVRDTWHLVTAGHVLRELAENLNSKRIALRSCCLVDIFGPDRKTHLSTPFVFEDAAKAFIDDKAAGLDFGLICLTPYYRRLLEANGVLPFSEIDWVRQPKEFEAFFLLGLPNEVNTTAEFDPQLILLNTVLIRVDKLETPPPEAKPTQYERFFGKLRAKDITDIKGMSGGPIYGLGQDSAGVHRYWVVGIQSGWFQSSRIIAATPLPVVGQLIEKAMRAASETP